MRCGIDLGGTNIAAGLVDDGHAVLRRAKVATPTAGPQAVIDAIVAAFGELLRKADLPPERIEAVGVGAPGPIDGGVVRTATNLRNWVGPVPLADLLGERLPCRVAVENDVTAAVYGEWVAGGGEGVGNLLGVWMGTGVGGGLVLDGRPFRGNTGGAGEFGHLTVRQGGALCGCGRRGCLEAYAGRANMEAVVDTILAKGGTTALEDIRQRKGKARYTSKVWAAALAAEDPLATRLLDEAVHAVGAGIGSVVNLLDLSDVVVGGGLTEALGAGLADRLAHAAREHLLVSDHPLRVRVSTLGDDAGIVGAAALS